LKPGAPYSQTPSNPRLQSLYTRVACPSRN
jgi:hypothetical protein